MLNRFFAKPERCKTCRKFLSAEHEHMGFCKECAAKEIIKLVKRIRISAVIGVGLAVVVFAMVYYARANAYVPDVRGYEGDIFVPLIFGRNFVLNKYSFDSIMNLSVSGHIILALACFLAPFGAYINLEIDTVRGKSEVGLYKLEPLVGNMAARMQNHRLEGVGMFIFNVFVSAMSGPFFFIYRPYKLWKLSNYVKGELRV